MRLNSEIPLMVLYVLWLAFSTWKTRRPGR